VPLNDTLIRVKNLRKHFSLRADHLLARRNKRVAVQAVNDVSFDIQHGETFALMGESGSGKTTCALSMIRLIEPTGGHVYFEGKDLLSLKRKALWRLRKDLQIVFQNPQEAMDPLTSVYNTIEEPLKIHHSQLSRKQRRNLVLEFAQSVGLREQLLKRYPRELSGGEQQRVCICRAVILRPTFIVLDEPTSALDVSVQARVLNLLCSLKSEFSLTYLFISHDAAVIRWMADHVGVLYLGQLVEVGETEAIFSRPVHPYTLAMIQSVLTIGMHLRDKEVTLKGAPPSAKTALTGCPFFNRCEKRAETCRLERPVLREVEEGHWVACKTVGNAEEKDVILSIGKEL